MPCRELRLDPNAIPGTVHIVDIEGTIIGKHASSAQLKDVVLVPAPSSVYTLTVGIASAAIYSVLTPISEDTGLTLNDLNAGTGYMFLLFGWGCVFWQAVALQWGKRPGKCSQSNLQRCSLTSYPVYLFSLLATLILQGFVGAPIESLCEISITDIYFAHERGAYMGLYALMLAGSNFLAPVLAGFINDGQNWHWVQYWCAIFLAVGFVLCFLFMEETNYDRVPLGTVSTLVDTPGTNTAPEKPLSTSSDPEKSSAPADSISNVEPSTGTVEYPRKTYMQKLSLLDKKRDFLLFRFMYRPFLFFSLPAVVYAGFSYGSNLVWFNVLNGTTSLILSGDPYNFPPSMVGLSYLSPLIGVAIVMLYLARRNHGVLESEYRLWLFTASLFLIPGALILWGVGAAHHIHWFGLVFAMGLIAATNTIGIQLSVSYCIDSYKDLSGEAMVTVILIRNTMSFAVGYGITPWVSHMGYQNAFFLAAFAGLAQVLTFLAVMKWGKSWRIRTKQRYLGFVKGSVRLGAVH
ncbi:unnamed protein product [Diplocarpon coronariae]